MKLSLGIYRPAKSVKVTCKRSGAYAFLFVDARGKFNAKGYTAKAKSHCTFYYAFATEAKRDAYVAEFFQGQIAHAERVQARRAERTQAHTLQVGHVFYSSWGYDQTNVDFYQVVRIVGKNSVEVRPIGSMDVTGENQGTADSGRCMPVIDDFKGPAELKRISMECGSASFRVASYASARIWDGKPKHYSWGR